MSLRAQIDPNDPDLRHEADRYIRPGQFPCSEAGLALRGPSWPHWLRRLRLRAHPVPPSEAEFPIIDFVLDGKFLPAVKPRDRTASTAVRRNVLRLIAPDTVARKTHTAGTDLKA